MTSPLTRYNNATRDLDPPLAIVDLDAFDANAAALVGRAGGTRLRVASKSVRCLPLLTRALRTTGFGGVMSFTLPEALWLAERGACDDILVAYPTVDRAALAKLAADESAAATITIMVDSVAHLDYIDEVTGPPGGRAPIRVCLDIDAAWRALGGLLRIGARRSPIRTPAAAAALAERIVARDGFRLVGLMAYESQVAGVGDNPPGRVLYKQVVRWMQAKSVAELAARRAAITAAVRRVCDLAGEPLLFVNGGGTGSVTSTAAEPAVTEVTAGSGLYHPHLFDYYRGFHGTPAALYALPIVRRPGRRVATALGGGYLASGIADRLRLPIPQWPAGLRYDRQEGAGEVQTPLLGRVADTLAIGDRVWFRHAKAGEMCERFDALHLISGDRIVQTVPTYRGEGRTFL